MDQSTALHKLLEAADLLGMLEDLTLSTSNGKLTPGSLAGIRITLRNVKESVLQSHDRLAEDIVNRAKARVDSQVPSQSSDMPRQTATMVRPQAVAENPIASRSTSVGGDAQRLTRNDIRASLERIIEG